MYRTIEMLYLIDPGRSRVISGHSRDIGCLYIFVYMEYWIMQERKRIWRPGGERLAPSVPVKDRPLSGPMIEFELY